MDKLISLQAAIEALSTPHGILYPIRTVEELPPAHQAPDEWCTDCKEYDKEKRSCPRWNRVIRQTVEELKKQKTGRWIHKLRHSEDKQFDYYEESCSVCGAEARFWWRNFKYCPMCGAKMEGIKGETDRR